MLKFGSYILYVLLLTIRHCAFWFYLSYKIISTFDLYLAKFILLHFISTPSNRSLTCAWFYLRYKKENYTKLSVVLFPVVLKVANFLLPYLCSVFLLLCRKPDVRIFSTNYARSLFLAYNVRSLFLQLCQRSLFLLRLCMNIYLATLGNVARVYPRISRVLHFYQHKNI